MWVREIELVFFVFLYLIPLRDTLVTFDDSIFIIFYGTVVLISTVDYICSTQCLDSRKKYMEKHKNEKAQMKHTLQ